MLAQENAVGEVSWHLSDHLGSIRDLVDGSGALVNHFVFDSFGNLVEQDNSTIQTRYLYTGREFDEETEFYYYRSRYFSSDLGRFINEDTIGFGGGDFNLYRYVENNPIAFIDPFGRFKVELRYIPVAGVSNHVDVVVTNRNKTTSYWARALNGGSIVEILGIGSSGDGTSSGDFGTIVVATRSGVRINNPNRVQLVYQSDGICMPEIGDQVQRRIQTTFLAIANRQIPYNALNRNSNSSAFTVLERSIPGGRRPFPKDGFSVPAWDIDVFTGNRSNALRPIPNLDPFGSVCATCIAP